MRNLQEATAIDELIDYIIMYGKDGSLPNQPDGDGNDIYDTAQWLKRNYTTEVGGFGFAGALEDVESLAETYRHERDTYSRMNKELLKDMDALSDYCHPCHLMSGNDKIGAAQIFEKHLDDFVLDIEMARDIVNS